MGGVLAGGSIQRIPDESKIRMKTHNHEVKVTLERFVK